jgi:DNA-binding NtrC family response regulator
LETLREIRKLRPHLLVIVVSGFAGDLPMQEPEVRDMVYQIVEKPISLQGLLEITTRAMGLLRR